MILGVGVDLVSVPRLAQILARSPRFAARVFHVREQTQAAGRPERLAARFAAKEAWLKAMGLPLFSVPLVDVWVDLADNGQPRLELSGRAAELAAERGVAACHLSLSHTAETAAAFVVLEGGGS